MNLRIALLRRDIQAWPEGSRETALVLVFVAVGFLTVAAGGVLAYACLAPSSNIFRPVLLRGPAGNPSVLLTFDDGPAPPFTEQILDILAENKIKAVFFLCGKNVERYPEIARRIVREGHVIGNHTYSHPLLLARSREFIAREIDRAQEVIEGVTGVRPTLFRPPYGARWFGLMPVLKQRELGLVMWSTTGYDWKYKTQAIVRSVTRGLHPGAVVLLHDGHEQPPSEGIDQSCTVQALPAIIQAAKKSGYAFTSIREMAELV